MEDFEYISKGLIMTDEPMICTDSITDANNEDNEMYGKIGF